MLVRLVAGGAVSRRTLWIGTGLVVLLLGLLAIRCAPVRLIEPSGEFLVLFAPELDDTARETARGRLIPPVEGVYVLEYLPRNTWRLVPPVRAVLHSPVASQREVRLYRDGELLERHPPASEIELELEWPLVRSSLYRLEIGPPGSVIEYEWPLLRSALDATLDGWKHRLRDLVD